MASIQCKMSRGHKYWYIVESRRVGGKPRPIVLAYLGKADGLLKRLQGIKDLVKLKSYSHGLVAALLKIASKLEIPEIINKEILNLYIPIRINLWPVFNVKYPGDISIGI